MNAVTTSSRVTLKGRGRPTKLTPDRHQSIVSKIRQGVPIEVVARASGVHPDSFYYWIERGEEDKRHDNRSIYSDFSDDILRARDELEAELAEKWKKIATEGLERIKQVYKEKVIEDGDGGYEVVKYLDSEVREIVGGGDWRGISEFMLRRYNERWNRKEGVEVTGLGGGPIQVESSIQVDTLPTYLKQMLVIASTGRPVISEELERRIQEEVGQRFIEVEAEYRVLGIGDGSVEDGDNEKVIGRGSTPSSPQFAKGSAGDWEEDKVMDDPYRRYVARQREREIDTDEL